MTLSPDSRLIDHIMSENKEKKNTWPALLLLTRSKLAANSIATTLDSLLLDEQHENDDLGLGDHSVDT